MDLRITLIFSEYYNKLDHENKILINYLLCDKLNIKFPVFKEKWIKGNIEHLYLRNYEDISVYISLLKVE